MDEHIVLVADSYVVLCPHCNHKNILSSASLCVQCAGCQRMIRCTEKRHRLAANTQQDVLQPGVLTVNTYAYACPDCETTNRVTSVSTSVRCPVCHSDLDVVEALFNGSSRQARLF